MAVQDLWLDRHKEHTARHGGGLRYRVVVRGWPSKACRTKAEAEALNAQAWVSGLQTSHGDASQSLRGKVLQCLIGSTADHVDLSGLRAGRAVKRDPAYLSVAQIGALAAAGARDAAMVWLLATCGLRISEACWLDVGGGEGRARHVEGPQVEERRGPGRAHFGDGAGHARSQSRCGGRRCSPILGGRVDPDNWRSRVFAVAREKAGMPALRIHDLRHTAASLAIASGADVKVIQRMLGHKSARMTLDLYGHLWDSALDLVASAIDERIQAG